MVCDQTWCFVYNLVCICVQFQTKTCSVNICILLYCVTALYEFYSHGSIKHFVYSLFYIKMPFFFFAYDENFCVEG